MKTYLKRYAYPEQLTEQAPRSDLGICVTIPAYNEPDLITALQSLAKCTLPEKAVEVHVLINYSQSSTSEVTVSNETIFLKARDFARSYSSDKLAFHIHKKKLPVKHAGVGLARKILMDEAVRRFEVIKNENGVITGFDADCTCCNNYFLALEKFFGDKRNGCSVYFEHKREPDIAAGINEAAMDYELHLRCYIDALRWCDIPHAFQTIGSSMAVNHKAYQRQGGMNKRKAGEDFYFLHRIIREGNFGDLTNTTIYPSPRASERVPFGTGKAVLKRIEGNQQLTYNPDSYKVMKEFTQAIEGWESEILIPKKIQPFLSSINFDNELKRIIKSSSNENLVKKHFYQWFDGLKTMKYLHFMRDQYYPDVEVNEGASQIKKWISYTNDNECSDHLEWFREFNRQNPQLLKY